MDDNRRDHPHTNMSSEKKPPQQLLTYNVPIFDVENTNGRNKGGNLLVANNPWTVPQRTERMPQGCKGN